MIPNQVSSAPELKSAPPQVKTSRRALWGLGGYTDFMVYTGITVLISPIFNIAMGIDARLVGIAVAIPRTLDIITDALIGHWSDNTNSRWGRRKPWIFSGALILALICALMWYPPLSCGKWASFAYLLAMLVPLYAIGYTMFVIPYNAQGYELSTDYNERTHILAWRMYFFMGAGLIQPWLYKLCLLPVFGNEIIGVRWVCGILAITLFLAALGPLFVTERTRDRASHDKISFFKALRFTIANPAFRPLALLNLIVKFGLGLTGPFMLYIEIYYVGQGGEGGKSFGGTIFGWMGLTINTIGIFGMWMITRLADRIGKKQAALLCLGISTLTFFSFWWTLTPSAPYLQLLSCVFVGLFYHPLWLLVSSMLADTCDEDELRTGLRREGMYSAVFTVCDKIALAVCAVASGFLLKAAGFDESLKLQAPSTLNNLMNMFVFVQTAGLLAGFITLLFYPLTKKRAAEIRAKLDGQLGCPTETKRPAGWDRPAP